MQGRAALASKVKNLSDITLEALPRFSTGFHELDRVLGGGIVPGSAILIGGSPGAGKSTLLLQTLCKLTKKMKTLYVTGEESLQNELGVFSMTKQGLREVSNPSAIFLSRREEMTPGSSVMVVWEGTRPLLVEIQALVDHSMMAKPRRVAVGLEQNRLSILLAVLHRHGGLQITDQDVFVNVVGGVKVSEPSADLALILAIVSSLSDRPLPKDLVIFGEVGLASEIRPVPSGKERIDEAIKHGFRRAIVPQANVPHKPPAQMHVFGVKNLGDALTILENL